MLAMVLFINFSDGTAREASFMAFQVFHFLLNMSLKLRACTRMQRLRPNPVHLQLATSTSQLPEKLEHLCHRRRERQGGDEEFLRTTTNNTALVVCQLTL